MVVEHGMVVSAEIEFKVAMVVEMVVVVVTASLAVGVLEVVKVLLVDFFVLFFA